jgi:2-(1,2-epoxy-1,2-dihydrophenyl)acetyl-CoA isomerase
MREIDTGTKDLLARVEDGVAVLTMNRPDRRNALSGEMLGALAETLAAVEVDDEVGCVVLTGAGGAFCAGGDVKGMAAASEDGAGFDARVHRQRLSHHATAGRLHRMPKPTIAMLPGAAAGAGLSLALACDLRYASARAKLGQPEINLGIIPGWGGTQRLARATTLGFAKELILTGRSVDADEALERGLVNAVTEPEELMPRVMEVALQLAAKSPLALETAKEAINRALSGDHRENLEREADRFGELFSSEDAKEGLTAFAEKREPRFTGR